MKLNYLLVMPCTRKAESNNTFLMGTAYVSAAMKKEGYKVFTLNLNICSGDIDVALKEAILDNDIDVLLTGGFSFYFNVLKELVDKAKNIKPSIKIGVGGGIITGDPMAAMHAFENVDFGMIGEGEITACELAYQLENENNLYGVEGLIFKKGEGEYIKNQDREDIKDLDGLSFPDYDGFGFEKSLTTAYGFAGVNKRKSVMIIGSRSCPYNCSFCFHTTGKKYRQRSLDNLFEEIEYVVKRYGVEYLFIADELFTITSARVIEFCERIKPYHLQWWAQFRVDGIDETLLKMAKESGCDVIALGLESADNRILKSMGKNITIEQIDKALRIVHDSGVRFDASFIFGDREETWESVNNTLKYWKENSKYRITLGIITVYPGSGLYKYAIEENIIKDPAQFLKDGCPQINVSKLTESEYGELVKKIFLYQPANDTLKDVEYFDINNKNGTVGIFRGTCTACGQVNNWNDVMLFANSNIICEKCGQRYGSVLNGELLGNIEKNIDTLVKAYGNIAVWGINYKIAELFENVVTFDTEYVYAVDISKIKQCAKIGNKWIMDPSVIRKKNIECVVIGIPLLFNQISKQIEENYPNVKRIIDISELICEMQ